MEGKKDNGSKLAALGVRPKMKEGDIIQPMKKLR